MNKIMFTGMQQREELQLALVIISFIVFLLILVAVWIVFKAPAQADTNILIKP